jgi:hypothetical protein
MPGAFFAPERPTTAEHPGANMPRIEKLLEQFPPDQRQARFIFDCCEEGYMVRALLSLPTGNLVARTQAPVPDAREAIDEVVGNLAGQIERLRVQPHSY